MNTPVKFELAKLLEEQGYPFEFITVGELKEVPLNIPTIAEVVMWLYEKYGIWTVVNVNIMGSWYFEHFDLKEKRNAQFEPTDTHYDSLTEAYEAAIEYTLNNLL